MCILPSGITKKHHAFLYGLVELDSVNIHNICPNGFTKVEQKRTIIDALLTSVVAKIIPVGYTPQTITVHCGGAAAYDLQLDEHNNILKVEPVAVQ